ncbi:MAG: hypothetical protein AA931_07045 [Peptococcaceae bacterium 1109]|nr:MAG: hypothetical protein AA931_07045 [Peptococcaceae bacterium 1109]
MYTLAEPGAWASAFLVRDGRIAALGTRDSLEAVAYRPRYIDLGGNFTYPGFTDAHVHLIGLGLQLQSLQLQGLSLAEVLGKVKASAEQAPAGSWIIGRGFNFNNWPEGRPHKAWLDEVAPLAPVALTAKDGHLMWVNSAALQACGITSETPNPKHGLIERDSSGETTGLLMENAISLVAGKIPPPSPKLREKAIKDAVDLFHSYGIVAVHDMGDEHALSALQQYREGRDLTLKVWLAIPAASLSHAKGMGIRGGFGDRFLRVGAVKDFADGALGARTAWMLDPYEGEGGYGLPTLSLEELSALVREANRWGLPVAVHAIGDAGNRAVLDALAAHGDKGLRNRIEHVQLLNSADIPRLAELNIVASMQPIQCPQDRYMADRYWGGRSRWAYPFQSLLRQGTHLAFGSDAPVEEADVLKGMYSAVARKRWDEPETEPWYGEEAVSMWDALRAFTYGGAYAAGEEDYRGVLAPGMLADFTVLTQDILAAGSPEILKETRVAATFVEGECVYER